MPNGLNSLSVESLSIGEYIASPTFTAPLYHLVPRPSKQYPSSVSKSVTASEICSLYSFRDVSMKIGIGRNFGAIEKPLVRLLDAGRLRLTGMGDTLRDCDCVRSSSARIYQVIFESSNRKGNDLFLTIIIQITRRYCLFGYTVVLTIVLMTLSSYPHHCCCCRFSCGCEMMLFFH